MVNITERGWPAHFIGADRCLFRRNTLIEGKIDSVIVSTIGDMHAHDSRAIQVIGAGRYYETMVFGVKKDGEYIDADVSDQRHFEAKWNICANSPEELPDDVDNLANDMHEAVVAEFTKRL